MLHADEAEQLMAPAQHHRLQVERGGEHDDAEIGDDGDRRHDVEQSKEGAYAVHAWWVSKEIERKNEGEIKVKKYKNMNATRQNQAK